MQRALRACTALVLVLLASGALTWNISPCYALWESSTAADTTLNLVSNGSFETGPAPGDYLPLDPGSTAIAGWTVTRGQIDYVGIWQSFDGVRSVDLDGTPGFGGIGQTIATTPGVEYRVSFAMAGNSHGLPEPKVLKVTAAGQSAVFSFDASLTSFASMGWQRKTWKFVATGTTAFLEFFSLDTEDGRYGPALDSVAVRAVPATLDSSVLALWHFDEGAGLTLHDASVYHNDGAIHNAAWVPGVAGSALRFDGLTSYVSGPNSPSLRPARDFMVDAWFAVDTFQFAFVAPPDSGGGGIFSNLGPYPWGGGFELGVRESGVFRSDYRVGSPISRFSGYTHLSQTHHFYHAVVVYARALLGVDSMTVVKTYLDDVLTDSVAFVEQVQYAGTDNFYIGTNIDGRAVGSFGIREFPGVIDEITIRKLDLSPAIAPPPPDSARVIMLPLIVANHTKLDTLVFGVHPLATQCIDPALGEAELPPMPPFGVFDARFVDVHPPPLNNCLVNGVRIDLRPSVGSARVDTYLVRFQPSSLGYPIGFSWPPLAGLYAGPVRLVDAINGSLVHIDMKQQLGYVLTTTNVNRLYIIASQDPDTTVPPPPAQRGVPLVVMSGAVRDTLRFGLDPSATYGLDPALGEMEQPPLPPSGVFDARFIEPRPEDAFSYFGLGVTVDLRPFTVMAQVDTYKVKFQPATGSMVSLSWPQLDSLYAGPVRLVDDLTGSLVDINMKAQTVYTVTNPLVHVLKIIATRGFDTTGATSFYRTFSQMDLAERARRLHTGSVPTGANVRDETFVRMGWFNNGLILGIPRRDSTLFYGWVYFRHNTARLPRFLPHTGAPRGFDFYIGGKPWHFSRANPAVKYHDNSLAGEQFVLKFNIGASDAGITPPGFGDLIFSDPSYGTTPFNGLTIRQLAARTDSMLTFFRHYPPLDFVNMNNALRIINYAFRSPVSVYTISPLTVAGDIPLSDVHFLHPNPAPAGYQPQPPVPLEEELPAEMALYQNYPNPFNPVTAIEFDLAAASTVTLRVYNTLGQEVAALLNRVPMDEGRQSVEFDGGGLPSGMYFYRLEITGTDGASASRMLVRKMVLMK